MAESEGAEQRKPGGGGRRLKQINTRLALLKNELQALREERANLRAKRGAVRATKEAQEPEAQVGGNKPTQA
jgi:prefoldin subunit 5